MSSSNLSRYDEEEMLQLAGIQHYMFCPRQWALIHIEQVWEENYLTTEGSLLHQNVDNPFMRETGHTDVLTLRGLRISSSQLGISGIADALEIHPYDDAPKGKADILKNKRYEALPVEYKRGKPKINDCDRMQVAAQCVLLEEMLGIPIHRGAIFYWETRHREYVNVDQEMKGRVVKICAEMHEIFQSRRMPIAVKRRECRSCSLYDQCLPSLQGKSVKKYLKDSIDNLELI
ncbi:MAG: CRISPR-associated protein Cas4 [Muribaculaceae bacterium]|nr:CRISPR-associated protein Cas4 [Muribaculaceae bacterium]